MRALRQVHVAGQEAGKASVQLPSPKESMHLWQREGHDGQNTERWVSDIHVVQSCPGPDQFYHQTSRLLMRSSVQLYLCSGLHTWS